jgi:hypothetical protein
LILKNLRIAKLDLEGFVETDLILPSLMLLVLLIALILEKQTPVELFCTG